MPYINQTKFDQLDLPKIIYKYRNWNNPDERKLLTENIAYFSSPKSWHKIDEFSLPTDYNTTPEILYDYFYYTAINNGYKEETERIMIAKKMVTDSPFHNVAYREKLEKEFREQLFEMVSGFCACESKTNQRLWDTFAGEEGGFCVGFDFAKMFPAEMELERGQRIGYFHVNNPPKLKPFYFSEDERMNDRMRFLFSLPEDYQSEEEYRLIKINLPEAEIKFNPESIKEIILRENMPDEYVEAIKKLRILKYPQSTLLKAIWEDSLYYYRIEPF